MRSIILIVILTALTATSVHAQGMWLAEGQSGIGLQGLTVGAEDTRAYGGALGFSTASVFDFGLVFVRTDYDTPDTDLDLKGTEWAPYLNVTLLKPAGEQIVGAELRGSYGFGKITSGHSFFRDVVTDKTTLGAGAYILARAADSFTFVPDLGLYYVSVSARPEGGTTSTASELMLSLAAHLALGRMGERRIVLTPGLQVIDNEQTWTLSASFVAPGRKKARTGWGS